jgi:hypothetical protein
MVVSSEARACALSCSLQRVPVFTEVELVETSNPSALMRTKTQAGLQHFPVFTEVELEGTSNPSVLV